MTRAAGPLGELVRYQPGTDRQDHGSVRIPGRAGQPVDASTTSQAVNGTLLLRRIAWVDDGGEPEKAEGPDAALRAATARALDPLPRSVGALLDAARERRTAAVAKLTAQGRPVRVLKVRPEWRLVIGLGEQTPAETGLTVHGTYGVPVLPASALKGAARAWTRELTADGQQPDDSYVWGAFGAEPGMTRLLSPGDTPDGRVVFLDALPEPVPGVPGPGVCVEVMTPHVGDYYTDGGVTPPAEYHQPVPVPFYAVTGAVAFTVYLVGRGSERDVAELVLEDDDAVVSWLAAALEQLGLGAKTNAGYGYLTVEVLPDTAPSSGPAEAS